MQGIHPQLRCCGMCSQRPGLLPLRLLTCSQGEDARRSPGFGAIAGWLCHRCVFQSDFPGTTQPKMPVVGSNYRVCRGILDISTDGHDQASFVHLLKMLLESKAGSIRVRHASYAYRNLFRLAGC